MVSVYDLILANYGLDRGLDDVNAAKDFAEVKAYTPAWAEQITGVRVNISNKSPASLPIRRIRPTAAQ